MPTHSAWKSWLSYLAEIPLEKGSSTPNPALELSLRKGRHYLTTPNAVYSYGDLYSNFSKTFRRIDLDKMHIRDVLLLGFGMGSVPFMLEKVFHKNYRYVGVEADEMIAAWAEKYVLPDLASPVKLHRADAFQFVCDCREKFDLVVMDIFLDDLVPEQFEQLDFLEKIKGLLNDGGLFLYNRLVDTEPGMAKTKAFLENSFRKVFPGAGYFDVGGNWVLTNS